MKKITFKSASILSLVLVGASAIAAAFTPNKETNIPNAVNGTITGEGAEAGFTNCTITADDDKAWSCFTDNAPETGANDNGTTLVG
jgi:GTP-dependent phosphoenolpyruvate carboxykinase